MMNTTNLFIEILIIGLGSFIAVLIFIFAFYPVSYDEVKLFVNDVGNSVLISVPFLVYFLGILFDRIADRIMQRKEARIRESFYQNPNYPEMANESALRDLKSSVYYKSSTMTSLLEYGRSRLRICRGWILNSFLIAIGLLLIGLLQGRITQISLISTIVIFFILTWLNYWAWKSMAKGEYVKLHYYGSYIKKVNGASDPSE